MAPKARQRQEYGTLCNVVPRHSLSVFIWVVCRGTDGLGGKGREAGDETSMGCKLVSLELNLSGEDGGCATPQREWYRGCGSFLLLRLVMKVQLMR